MKAVLPALTGRGHEHLAIQEGGTASLEFLRVACGDLAAEERQRVRRKLEEYCGFDADGIVWVSGRTSEAISCLASAGQEWSIGGFREQISSDGV